MYKEIIVETSVAGDLERIVRCGFDTKANIVIRIVYRNGISSSVTSNSEYVLGASRFKPGNPLAAASQLPEDESSTAGVGIMHPQHVIGRIASFDRNAAYNIEV